MRTRLAIAVFIAGLALAGCAAAALPGVVFEATGAPLSSAAAEKLAASTDIGVFRSVESSAAPALRAAALRELRAKGEPGVRAAELLTTGFPAVTTSVPVLVRICAVDGVDAIVVVEVYGDAGGKLTHRRLWVFGRTTGAVLRAASFL